jgi:cytochrome c oxidase subunit IV
MSASEESALRLWIRPALVWAALLVLLGITVGGAYVPLGPFNTVLALAIAAAKAALVFIFFMHLTRSSALLRLAAVAGLFWLIFLFSLSLSDYFTRPWNGSGMSLARPSGSIETDRTDLLGPRLPLDESK